MLRTHFLTLGFASISVMACSARDTSQDEGNVGQVALAVATAPSDVQCVVIQATGSGRTVSRPIDVTPGQAISTTVSGLPTGSVSIGANAYPTTCASVTASSIPNWTSDPVIQTISLTRGTIVGLDLVLRPSSSVKTNIDWQDDGVGGAGGSGGTGGTGTGGAGGTAANPPGFYTLKAWNVTSTDWHGCVWTAIDTVTNSTTSLTPKDFTAGTPAAGPYRVSGTLFNDYNAVAILGFNMNEAATGSSTQCAYSASRSTAAGPPAATIPSGATGIALNWSAAKSTPLRVQIQASDAATNPLHRWCANITDATGPTFVKFTDFYTQCWNAGTSAGNQYANEAIDAITFLVPGTAAQALPFDFTISGFAPGTSKSDAPGSYSCGTLTGSVGSTTASQTASMQRARTQGTDCKQYVVQNNNYGNPTGSTQLLNYTGSTFTVQSSNVSGSSAPGSFPSIYIGANGNIGNGTYSTWADSGLPKQISAMASAQSSVKWSGPTSGDFDSVVDAWFAKAVPTAGGYNDAVSGEIKIWLYKPSARQPIGSIKRQATIAGHSWDVWVGPKGTTSTGTDAANRPVVSYVAKDTTPVTTLSFNLKDFINDAVTNGSSDMSAGGTGQAFTSSWYLTDVMSGFEIWTGSTASSLQNTFTCTVQ